MRLKPARGGGGQVRQQIHLSKPWLLVEDQEKEHEKQVMYKISFPQHSLLASSNQEFRNFLNWRMHLEHCLTPRASLNLTNPFLNPFIFLAMPQYPVAMSSTT